MKDFLQKIGSSELQSLANMINMPLTVVINGTSYEKKKSALIDDIDMHLGVMTLTEKETHMNAFLQSGRMNFFPYRYEMRSQSFNNLNQHYNVEDYGTYYVYEPKTLQNMMDEYYLLRPKKSDIIIIFKKGLSGLSLPISKIGKLINTRLNIRLEPYLHIDTVKKLFGKIQNSKLNHVINYNTEKVGIFFYSYASSKNHLSISAKIDNSNKIIKKDLTGLINNDITGIDAMPNC